MHALCNFSFKNQQKVQENRAAYALNNQTNLHQRDEYETGRDPTPKTKFIERISVHLGFSRTSESSEPSESAD